MVACHPREWGLSSLCDKRISLERYQIIQHLFTYQQSSPPFPHGLRRNYICWLAINCQRRVILSSLSDLSVTLNCRLPRCMSADFAVAPNMTAKLKQGCTSTSVVSFNVCLLIKPTANTKLIHNYSANAVNKNPLSSASREWKWSSFKAIFRH